MAEDHVGLRKDTLREWAPWTKLFTAFKVALDPKKLLLAAGGIFCLALGWWILANIFWLMAGKKPEWSEYRQAVAAEKGEKQDGAFKDFKTARQRWNKLLEMAGPAPDGEKDRVYVDHGDLANSAEEYEELERLVPEIGGRLQRLNDPIKIEKVGASYFLDIKGNKVQFQDFTDEDFNRLDSQISSGSIRVRNIQIPTGDKAKGGKIILGETPFSVLKPEELDPLRKYIAAGTTEEEIRREVKGKDKERMVELAIQLQEANRRAKPSAQLRTWPWFEDRGPNPFLLVTGQITDDTGTRKVPWERGQFVGWFFNDQLKVLIEPLVKFFRPVLYLFGNGIGPVNGIYLILVILWSLAVWALFGGAITRMAAVQIARPNERISLTDAFKFSYTRFKSYFSAPVIPLVFLFLLTAVLWVFGLLVLIPWFGEIVVAGLFWVVVLLVGLIMAVVLVGLVGWPLMYSTISTEGSDSFDAISRSYSYVYQAPWQYLWYSFVALVYGAVLIFFIGLMGSLTVYMGKWAVGQAPQTQDREQSYLYMYAPTSFGWRDLLLAGSPNTHPERIYNADGNMDRGYTINKDYMAKVSWANKAGAFLVAVWIYLVFLLVVGFGYSYFWTASTIIYLLMRRVVDDTEMDEVHLEEDDADEPYPTAPAPTAPTKPAPATGGPVMVDSPTMRTPMPTPEPLGGEVKKPEAPPADPFKTAAPPAEPLTEKPPEAGPPGGIGGGEEKSV